MTRKAKRADAPMATAKQVKFQATKGASWETGTGYFDGKTLLAISAKRGTILRPPYACKVA